MINSTEELHQPCKTSETMARIIGRYATDITLDKPEIFDSFVSFVFSFS